MDQNKDFFNEFLQDMLYICRKAQYYYDDVERNYDNLKFKEKHNLEEEGEDISQKISNIIKEQDKIGVIKFTLFNAYQELQDLQKDPYKNQKD